MKKLLFVLIITFFTFFLFSSQDEALREAIINRNTEELIHLLKNNTSMNKEEVFFTALHSESLESLKILSEYGVNIQDFNNSVQKNALLIAVQRDNLDIIKYLVSSGIPYNTLNENGQNILDIAIEQNISTVILAYLMSLGLEPTGVRLYDIHDYVNINSLRNVILAINSGESIDTQDEYGNTPLVSSIANNNSPSLINYLIKNGANVNIKNNRGDTALSLAINKGNYSLVLMLVEHGADIFYKNAYNQTYLIQSVFSGNNKLITYFATCGLDIHAIDSFGYNALDYALETSLFLESLGITPTSNYSDR